MTQSVSARTLRYLDLTRFLLPLALTVLVLEFGGQVLNGGMARMPNATLVLAGFGLAWTLVNFLASPLAKVKQLSLVLVEDQAAQSRVFRFVVGGGLLLMAGLASLTLTPIGDWVIEDLHQVEGELESLVRMALLWLIPVPLLKGLSLYYGGLLIRMRRTAIASYAMIASIALSIAVVFASLSLEAVRSHPIALPILATHANILLELAIVYWGYRRYVRVPHLRDDGRSPLTYGQILSFFWPLALIVIVQELSRPLINLFIAREPNGVQELAVLTVVYALGHLHYGWLNELPNLHPAFKKEAGGAPMIRRFIVACGLLSLATAFLLFWTPLRDVILVQWIGVTPEFAALCVAPLYIFTFFTLPVTLRAHYHGVGMIEFRTQVMAPSAPARIVAILATMLVLPLVGVHGATLGVAALFAGFLVEATAVWWGVRGRSLMARRSARSGHPTYDRPAVNRPG